MKKTVLLLLIGFVLVSSVFGWQETFLSSSVEYKQVQSLCRIAGIEFEALVSPVSGQQLLNILSRIPVGSLNNTEQALFSKLVDRLRQPDVVFQWDDAAFDAEISSNPQLYYHSADTGSRYESIMEKRKMLPFFAIDGDLYLSKYLFGSIDIEWVRIYDVGNRGFQFSLSSSMTDMENTTPHRAFLSAGLSGFNFILGRDRLSYGNGRTGNLILGDNLWYEDFAKFSILKHPFSYDCTLMTFDTEENHESKPYTFSFFDFNSPNQLVAVHQFSFNPVKWGSISVSEGMLQYGNNLTADFSILNPFMMFHNICSYTRDNSNNFFGINLSITPVKGLQFNAELMFDQIQLKSELQDGKPTENMAPNANGYLANVIYSFALPNGTADFYIEGVYTNPAVYLKEKEISYNYWDVDLIVGNTLWNRDDSDVSYLGYKYGPDTIAVGSGFEYCSLNNVHLGCDVLYKIHGCKGLSYYENQQDFNNVGPDYFYLKTPTYEEGVTLPEHRVIFDVYAEYQFSSWLKLQGEAAYIHAWNYHNIIGKPFDDFQLALGVRINPVHLGAKKI